MSRIEPPAGVVPLRDQYGAVVRRAVLQAARTLLVEHGYAGVSMKALAAHAGVAVQTIYSAFGSKAGVVAALADLIDEEAQVFDIFARLQAATEPDEMLRCLVAIRRRIRERCGDIVTVLRTGAQVAPEVATAWDEGLRRRHGGMASVMQRIEEMGALKEGLTAERASAIGAALVADEVVDVLVDQRGWSFDEYETWLSATLAGLLLRERPTPSA